MLVLSRRPNEGVTLKCQCGCVTEVVVTELRSRLGKVRLGFTAPKTTNIYRNELAEGDDANDQPVPRAGDSIRGPGADPLCDPAGDVHHQAHAAG